MNLKNHFGLDIGSSGLKLVQLSNNGNSLKLEAIAQMPLSLDVSLTEISVDLTPLTEAIKLLVKQAKVGTKSVAIALPESQIYTNLISLPPMSDAELNQAIKFQLEQFVPLPSEEVTEKHWVVSRPEKGTPTEEKTQMEILLVAAPNFLVERYVQVIEKSGLELAAIDTEILSATRALVGVNTHSPTTLIIDLGSKGANLSVVKRGELLLTRSISSGGMAIARAVASELNLDIVQAEEYKKTYGLDETKLSGSVVKAIAPILDIIITEVKRVLGTLESTLGDEQVKRVVLTGGMAYLPGLVPYLATQFNFEVEIANPFNTIERSPEQTKYIGETGAIFTNAVGLALKGI